MSERRCCAVCFGDYRLRDNIIDLCDPISSTCGYCGTSDVKCVVPQRLSQWFEPLIATYEVVDDGAPIVELLMDDWKLFEGSGLGPADAKELLADVLDDGEVVRRSFSPMAYTADENLQRWEELRDEMMHRNRWFLDDPMDMDRIAVLLTQLITSAESLKDLRWYRARLLSGDTAYELHEMGAPPPQLAGHGRANPAGIPYLYLGSTPATAVSELRPHTGEKACVAEFTFRDLRFADLRDPKRLISPLIGDESEIVRLRADLPLLERLGEELTRPVQPRGAPFEYIPTQYLCEHIKKCGFDGVVYRSSVSTDEGINLALFEPEKAVPIRVNVVAVEQVSVRISN